MPVLEVKNLEKQFVLHTQDGTVLDVLKGVSFSLEAGEIAALCGPSGVGKSSLLKAIFGTYIVNRGTIAVDVGGQKTNIAESAPREVIELRRSAIGYVSQFLRVIPRVSTLDIVANAAIEMGKDPSHAKNDAAVLLEKLNIPSSLHSLSPLTFSGGEQQRVNIARAMSAPRPLMLFDEPTASLDPVNRATVLEMIKELASTGAAVLGIFHSPEDRQALGAREIVMQEFKEKEYA